MKRVGEAKGKKRENSTCTVAVGRDISKNEAGLDVAVRQAIEVGIIAEGVL